MLILFLGIQSSCKKFLDELVKDGNSDEISTFDIKQMELKTNDADLEKLDGLAHLKELKKMRQLYFDDTKVTDLGLTNLYNMKGLYMVDCRGTGVTEKGIEALKKAIPGVKVHWKWSN